MNDHVLSEQSLRLLGLPDYTALEKSVKTGRIFEIMEEIDKKYDRNLSLSLNQQVLAYLKTCDSSVVMQAYRKLLKDRSAKRFNECLKELERKHYRHPPSRRKYKIP